MLANQAEKKGRIDVTVCLLVLDVGGSIGLRCVLSKV